MIRVLLVFLAVLIAVLAFMFDRPWLYGAAAVPLAGALGLLARHLWTSASGTAASDNEGRRGTRSSDDSLEDLGISDVRPRDNDGAAPDASEPAAGAADAGASNNEEPGAEASVPSPPTDPAQAESSGGDWDPVQSQSTSVPDTEGASARSTEQPVLGPFLESLRAAIGAQTVCLLVQEEVVLEYRIEALASVQPHARSSGTFETQSPLLTATMSRQAVTIQALDGPDDRVDLGYYKTPPAVNQLALAPVPEPDSATTVFLLADATAEANLGTSWARSLIEQFAEMVGVLRDRETAASPQATASEASGEPENPDSSAEEQPRPRREIIAEEMEAATAADDHLALVLVHLNRAESIARQGDEAVASAERHLRTRLEHLAPGQRVERFGELTYGLFPRSEPEEVEAWAAELEEVMARETGELEGGVSVGVAVCGPRHDPESLRADAIEALREAYETGACTIVT